MIAYQFSRFRLTPTYLYVILFIIYVFPFLGNGPQWFMEGPDSNQSRLCVKYWWTNILYISNFYPTEVKKMVKDLFFTSFDFILFLIQYLN